MAELRIKSDLKGVSTLSSLQCVLSDGTESAPFEKQGSTNFNLSCLQLERGAVKRILLHVNNGNELYKLVFLGEQDSEVAIYCPGNHCGDPYVIDLGEEEELIGIYGVMGKKQWLTTFGFIVKTPYLLEQAVSEESSQMLQD